MIDSAQTLLFPRNRWLEVGDSGELSIDDQLKFARLHDWQVRRLGALNAELPIHLCHLRSVVHQATGFRKLSTIVDGGNRMARRQGGQLPRR